ncbi:MAG TPA: L-lactate permease, partial [Terriglobales bacterium]|nr:L-lactate permease [Terriglobales bacterium]
MGTTTTPVKAAPPKENLLLPAILAVVTLIVVIYILRIPPLAQPWPQGYDPTGVWWLSTIVAALPVVVLLGALALHVKAHYAALLGLASALVIAIFGFHMPARMAGATAVLGAGYGLFPIGWIVLNVIFMYQLTVESGRFDVLK